MNVEYHYKPTSGIAGNDFVILEIQYNKTEKKVLHTQKRRELALQ